MGWNNPSIPWSELERKLSDQRRPGGPPLIADGGDSPAWSRKRHPYRPSEGLEAPAGPIVPYAELHAHSTFSFLDGASTPEQLVEEAHRLGLSRPRRHRPRRLLRHRAVRRGGRELPRARDRVRRRALARAQRAADRRRRPRGRAPARARPAGGGLPPPREPRSPPASSRAARRAGPSYALEQLAEQSGGEWVVPTGCRKGAVRRALARRRARMPRGASSTGWSRSSGATTSSSSCSTTGIRSTRRRTTRWPGSPNAPGCRSSRRTRCTTPPPASTGSPPRSRRCGRRRSLDELDGWLPASDGLHLRSGAEMMRRFERYPGAVARSVTLAEELGFRLRSARPRLPRQEVPAGHTPMSWLRELVWAGAEERYPGHARPRARAARTRARRHRAEGLPRLLPHRATTSCARRAAAASCARGAARPRTRRSATCSTSPRSTRSSSTCRSSGSSPPCATRSPTSTSTSTPTGARRSSSTSTASTGGTTPRRSRTSSATGRRPRCATWRRRSATPPGSRMPGRARSSAGARWSPPTTTTSPAPVVELAEQLLTFPRHLGIHSGGMVLTDRPVGEVCPIEHARMENRTVLQWDKDDCAWMGLVKFDLLGLGMLAALQYTFDLVREHTGEEWELATIPKEEAAVYDMLCRADSIGVFQVESRAQMGTLPRLQPRCFYDLVVEIALIRPGPGAGRRGAPVHPPAHRRGAGELPASEARAGARPHARGAALPGAAHADGGRRGRLQRRRRRPAAPGDGVEARRREDRAAARRSSTRAWPRTASSPRSPIRSTPRSRRSRTSASPRATR